MKKYTSSIILALLIITGCSERTSEKQAYILNIQRFSDYALVDMSLDVSRYDEIFWGSVKTMRDVKKLPPMKVEYNKKFELQISAKKNNGEIKGMTLSGIVSKDGSKDSITFENNN
jgi:hypothetical protein